MQLDGFLSRFALRELLELSIASLVTGEIEVQAPAGVHQLFFVAGKLVHAVSPQASGFDAVWPIFELSDAPFQFVAGAMPPERTFAEPTLQVIERAIAVAQRWSTIRALIPRLDIVPVLVSPREGEHVRIFEEDWPILSSVDGTRTIADVAHTALLDPLDVCSGLLRLQERGLVMFCPPELTNSVPRPEPVPSKIEVQPSAPPVASPKQRSSFFARLLDGDPANIEPPCTALEPPVVAMQSSTSHEYDDILSLLRS